MYNCQVFILIFINNKISPNNTQYNLISNFFRNFIILIFKILNILGSYIFSYISLYLSFYFDIREYKKFENWYSRIFANANANVRMERISIYFLYNSESKYRRISWVNRRIFEFARISANIGEYYKYKIFLKIYKKFIKYYNFMDR